MGLDLGIEKAGFKTVLAVENNATAVATIQLNRPDLPVIPENIRNVSCEGILARAGTRAGDVCLVTGGPCCQTFSTVGSRNSIQDERGNLFLEFRRVVAGLAPRFFVMENVKGILSSAIRHRPLKQRGAGHPPLSADEELGSAFGRILEELSTLGYYVVYGLLNAADFGSPQTRLRVVVVGSRDGEAIELPEPTHSERGSGGKLPWITLRAALSGLEDDEPECLKFRACLEPFFNRLTAGQNWRHLPEELREEALGGAFHSWGGRCGFLRRLAWNRPAPTLTTSPVGRATSLCHPDETRPLSVREYARLQQFSDDWEFAGSVSAKYRQIGNAVPLALGAAVGQMFRRTMTSTGRKGLLPEAAARKRKTVCGCPQLASRLAKRPRTYLEPSRFRDVKDAAAGSHWLRERG